MLFFLHAPAIAIKPMEKLHYTLITGASLGLGRALSIACAQRGMSLVLVALPHSGLPELSTEIRSRFGVDVVAIEKDLCRSQSCSEVLEFVKRAGLKISCLINNAGGGSTELFAAGKLATYEKQIELNVLATVQLTHLFLELLREGTPAYVLNVGSLAAYFTVPQKGIYSASKSFVLSFSKTLREELRKENISVSVVCPSGMPTNPLSIQMIRGGSLFTRVSCMAPERVAQMAIQGMLARKRVIIPGTINRLFLAIDKILPLFLKRLLLNSVMKRLREGAENSAVAPLHSPTPLVPNPAAGKTGLVP
jgi:uncharacterized protein